MAGIRCAGFFYAQDAWREAHGGNGPTRRLLEKVPTALNRRVFTASAFDNLAKATVSVDADFQRVFALYTERFAANAERATPGTMTRICAATAIIARPPWNRALPPASPRQNDQTSASRRLVLEMSTRVPSAELPFSIVTLPLSVPEKPKPIPAQPSRLTCGTGHRQPRPAARGLCGSHIARRRPSLGHRRAAWGNLGGNV